MWFFFINLVLYLLALESGRGLCILGWRINQHLMGLFLFLRVASSECPYGPLKPRVANWTTVYWTCILWPAASYSCQMVWKTSTVSCYSASGANGWLFINLWKWKVSFCFSKIVVITISCKLWLLKILYSRKVKWSCYLVHCQHSHSLESLFKILVI